MNLRTLLPSLADDIHRALEAAGITTAQEFLFNQDFQLYHQFPESVATQIRELKAQVAERVSAPATRGDELFHREEEKERAREACLCGVDELDGLLGGFGKYGVIEIAGDKRSGKTGIVLQVVLRHLALYPDHTALWLDVGGEFTVERAADILQLNPGIGSETALDRLSITTCFDVATAHRALEELRISLGNKNEAPHRMRFLVVDPLTPLFAPILSATSSQGHAVMMTFMRQLGSLARTYALTGLVTNASVQSLPQNPYSAFSTTTTKPALGPSFTFLTDDTVWLSDAQNLLPKEKQDKKTMGTEVFIAEVFRSRSTFSKTWCAFVIRNGISLERFLLPDRPTTLIEDEDSPHYWTCE
ncbi:hypothetical protein JB92DRAFT_2121701 [Gautieria morchelliformis]|nr:hypothetical protein JB92DRAFT_2121701 [Gautieria morchelliformis]